MRPTTRIALGTLAAVFVIYAGPTRAAPEITICHMPQDDPRTAQTLRIGIHDWPDHKSHGDETGACQMVFGDSSPAGREEGTLDAHEPGSDDDPAALGGGSFEAVLCDDRPGDHGRVIEVSETGRISVRSATCG